MTSPLSKLTPAAARKVVAALRAGNFRNVAARVGGFTPRAFRRYMRAGLTDPDSAFGAFRAAVLKAEQDAEARELKRVLLAGEKDWKASAWFLERKFPERWGRRDPQRLELTGKGGGPIEAELLHGLTDEERTSRIAAILGLEPRPGGGGELADRTPAAGALPAAQCEAEVVAVARPADAGTGEPG